MITYTMPLASMAPIIKGWIKDALKEHEQPEKFDQDERITRKEVCRLYKISLPTVHELMKKGLPYEKAGRKTLFKRSDVDAYFSERRAK